jgi:hypothetical protein
VLQLRSLLAKRLRAKLASIAADNFGCCIASTDHREEKRAVIRWII